MSYVYNPQLGQLVPVLPQNSQNQWQNAQQVYSGALNANNLNNVLPNYASNTISSGVAQNTSNVPVVDAQPVWTNNGTFLNNGNGIANGAGGAGAGTTGGASWDSLDGMFGKSGWVTGALSGIGTLGNMYFNYQAMKTQKQALEEQTKLNRANFKNTAKTLNAQYRDQMSGRSYNGMGASSVGALGQTYQNRKVDETY